MSFGEHFAEKEDYINPPDIKIDEDQELWDECEEADKEACI